MSSYTLSQISKLLVCHPTLKTALCSTNATRSTKRLLLSSYSRMLDMGGAPSSLHDKNATRINASKNCKVQAVCFDFDVLTRSIGVENNIIDNREGSSVVTKATTSSGRSPVLGDVKPNVGIIHQVAGLLNVDLGGAAKRSSRVDDLSGLTGEKNLPPPNIPTQDPRAKYAAKLQRKGVEGGIAGVDLAKHQIEETLRRGDAAGHLAARKIASAEPVGNRTKWMAMTGTGSLLQYLSQRSMKLCLLPKPCDEVDEEEGRRMEDFKKQLSDVVLDLLVKDGSMNIPKILDVPLHEFEFDPTLVLVVSDSDDYIRAAKEKGMVTCRIRPANARRGNVSAHYMVESVPDVRNVVDEINGISFNAVLKGR